MNIIWNIYEDSRGNLWLSALGHGLIMYQPDKKSFITLSHCQVKVRWAITT